MRHWLLPPRGWCFAAADPAMPQLSDLAPGVVGASSSLPTAFECLQARVLARALRTFPEPHHDEPLRAAIILSARAAQTTDAPMHTLPGLFREVAIAVMLRAEWGRSVTELSLNRHPAACQP